MCLSVCVSFSTRVTLSDFSRFGLSLEGYEYTYLYTNAHTLHICIHIHPYLLMYLLQHDATHYDTFEHTAPETFVCDVSRFVSLGACVSLYVWSRLLALYLCVSLSRVSLCMCVALYACLSLCVGLSACVSLHSHKYTNIHIYMQIHTPAMYVYIFTNQPHIHKPADIFTCVHVRKSGYVSFRL